MSPPHPSFVCLTTFFFFFSAGLPLKKRITPLTPSDNDFQLTSLSPFRGLITLSHLILVLSGLYQALLLLRLGLEERLPSEKGPTDAFVGINAAQTRSRSSASLSEGQNGTSAPPSGRRPQVHLWCGGHKGGVDGGGWGDYMTLWEKKHCNYEKCLLPNINMCVHIDFTVEWGGGGCFILSLIFTFFYRDFKCVSLRSHDCSCVCIQF